MNFVELTLERYPDVLCLMKRTAGICVREADSLKAVSRYLSRNPGLSFIAIEHSEVIGCAMSGHDGRRGYLQHVIVDEEFRHKGIAKRLIERCLDALEKEGIFKTHIDVLISNEVANEYWSKNGWVLREDIYRYSYNRSSNENA